MYIVYVAAKFFFQFFTLTAPFELRAGIVLLILEILIVSEYQTNSSFSHRIYSL